jgi:predicted DNA binding CopG/RHH family protein
MSKQELDPPREAWETAEYEDDPFELGDIDETRLKIVSKDFLPKPEELVFKQARRKVTITLDQNSIDFFKSEAARRNVPYQRMIRNLLTEYVNQQQQHYQRERSSTQPRD